MRSLAARAAVLLALLIPCPAAVEAQFVRGSIGATLMGASLGAYSGATLGLLAGLVPCHRTADGQRCVVSVSSVGGAFGIAMGGIIGSQNPDALRGRLGAAGVGAGAGALLGAAWSGLGGNYRWADAAAGSLVGGAIGAAPLGALMGGSAGALAGGVLWLAVPDAGVQEMVLITLAGTAIGGLLDWADGAADKDRTGVRISFSIAP